MSADIFAPHIEVVARHVLGEPNPRLSTKTNLRWGAQGSMSVDTEKGVFYDNEAAEGGGVLDLIRRVTGKNNGEAVALMRDELRIEIPDDRPQPGATSKIVATYDYVDEDGEVLFQVVRLEPKTFRQRRPDPSSRDGWSWTAKGVRQVPYRFGEITEAISHGHTIYVAEGERDVDELWKRGYPATCNAGGAGKWQDGLSDALRGADVVILPDNDDAGRNHRDIVAASLLKTECTVRVLNLPGLPLKGDVSDWFAAGNTTDMLRVLTDELARPWKSAPPASRFGAIQWCDLDSVSAPLNWLVKNMLHCSCSGLIYGASGSGKSFLAVDMGLAIARGVPFLGNATRKGTVIYQAGEGGRGLVKRLKAYRQHYGLSRDDVPFILLPERVNLFSPDGDAEAFEEECVAWSAVASEPLAAIFIDTFATASPGANENTSEDMGRMLDVGQRLGDRTGASVIWVHHKNAAGERERGHSSFRAHVDTAWEVNREDEESKLRTLRLAKLKDGEDGLKIGFELQSVSIGSDDDGEQITSCVVCPAQEGSMQTGKRAYLPAGQFKFLRLLDDAIVHKGGVLPVQDDRIPTNMMGVEWHQFRALYVMVGGQGLTEDSIRQALKRDGEKLSNAGLIDRFDPWIWITDQGRATLR